MPMPLALYASACTQTPTIGRLMVISPRCFLPPETGKKPGRTWTKMEALDADSVVGAWPMARYWHQQQQFEKARVYAEKVRLVRPGHAQARHLLGNIYLGLNQPEKALPEFEAAVRLAPERADFRADLQRLKSSPR